jgi:hypothetical protein
MKNNNILKNATEDSAKWARWIALYEAVNIIIDKAEDKKIPLEKIVFKPLDIRDYISATEDIIHRKILSQEYNIKIDYKEEENSKKEEFQFV